MWSLSEALAEWLHNPHISLTLSTSEEVEQLREEVARLRHVARVAEVRYGDEVQRCMRLQDLLKSHGIKYK